MTARSLKLVTFKLVTLALLAAWASLAQADLGTARLDWLNKKGQVIGTAYNLTWSSATEVKGTVGAREVVLELREGSWLADLGELQVTARMIPLAGSSLRQLNVIYRRGPRYGVRQYLEERDDRGTRFYDPYDDNGTEITFGVSGTFGLWATSVLLKASDDFLQGFETRLETAPATFRGTFYSLKGNNAAHGRVRLTTTAGLNPRTLIDTDPSLFSALYIGTMLEDLEGITP
jgi:hypothetical protein